ncbi:TAXI family TRAP transporter solute-binding subunit [Litorivicinus lipolyticus]|uniref:TAXI family TRAP transporter solute-binding subunit n=1 Tax=Litorivicinus lipolyticus TaxID=418701 RepID=A0A5Q2QGD1_9GAMM|nr:TAXI family TRAP transporter solute-binding subunit [Litorivicinus lipolyticus]QGG80065.1 TAXI family TRAP transporter solute-binding subunit [Litorivicinus lipolyticus]
MKQPILAGLAVAAMGLTPLAQAEGNYILATASTGGTYYPVGVAISTLTKIKLQPKMKIGMSAINSAGSGENLRLLREGEAQFAILQGLYGYYGYQGVGPVEKDGAQKHLRSVSMLWQNVEHYIVQSEFAKTGTVDDIVGLKGETLAMGNKNSGTIGSNAAIMSNLGLDIYADVSLMHGGYGPSADALQNGQVAGVGIPAGIPVGAITKLKASAGDDVTLLTMTPEQQKRADGGFELWTPFTIPAGTYPGQDADVQTVAQPNFMATHADVNEEDVYLITKTIYENLAFLNGIHPATKAMALEKAISGLPAPLHPGAARFYQEQGIEIPARLIAN